MRIKIGLNNLLINFLTDKREDFGAEISELEINDFGVGDKNHQKDNFCLRPRNLEISLKMYLVHKLRTLLINIIRGVFYV